MKKVNKNNDVNDKLEVIIKRGSLKSSKITKIEYMLISEIKLINWLKVYYSYLSTLELFSIF